MKSQNFLSSPDGSGILFFLAGRLKNGELGKKDIAYSRTTRLEK
jgi:hypothetical protein